MRDKYSLFPVVMQQIEYNNILKEAIEELKLYAGSSWTDFSEHDPGITLLEALGYGVADIGYRYTRPLNDLLTPDPETQQEESGLFPAEFGPQMALTCSPITEDDYRRALLDLHSTGDDDGYYFFKNVSLVREPESERYRYWYNSITREFTFKNPDYDGEYPANDIALIGNYYLYILPSEEAQGSQNAAKAALDEFLLNNRNLGESISKVIWLKPEDLFIELKIELNDDVDIRTSGDIAVILAGIYQAVTACITPPVARYSTEQLSELGMRNEDIYQGPFLFHGWIPELPTRIDPFEYSKVNLSEVVNVILNIKGINKIISLVCKSAQGDDVSELQWVANRPGCYPRLWGKSPMEALAAGNVVQLLSCSGIQLNSNTSIANNVLITVTKEEIEAAQDKLRVNKNIERILPYGRWRNPGKYYPATHLLPSCYNMKVPAVSSAQTHLHQFLLIFEQLLANECQQLALLPMLLSFKHKGDKVWAQSWPFSGNNVSDIVHSGYRSDLEKFMYNCGHDLQQALSITGYQLGYFNRQLAPNAFQQPLVSFLASQQGGLSRQAELGYYRANIRTDRISSLQLRIAARLGLGGAEIFYDNARPELLPFYLVEHRALLPVAPALQYNNLQIISKAVIKESQTAKRYLALYCDIDLAALEISQKVDIILEQGTQHQFLIRGQIVKDVNAASGYFLLDIIENTELYNKLDDILDADYGTLAWQNCMVLFEDINFDLVYSADQSGLNENQRRLSCTPFPVMLSEGDSIDIFNKRAARYLDENIHPVIMSFNVVSIDRIENTLVVNDAVLLPGDDETHQYQWHVSSSESSYLSQDRFSFMVSVVFNQELLNNSSDKYVTEEWCRREILAEMPSHINVIIHWKPDWEFRAFALSYKTWQESGLTNSATVYELLYWLSLGKSPSPLYGIGAMYIASANQQETVVGPDGLEWDKEIINTENLFYIP